MFHSTNRSGAITILVYVQKTAATTAMKYFTLFRSSRSCFRRCGVLLIFRFRDIRQIVIMLIYVCECCHYEAQHIHAQSHTNKEKNLKKIRIFICLCCDGERELCDCVCVCVCVFPCQINPYFRNVAICSAGLKWLSLII